MIELLPEQSTISCLFR